MTLGLPTVKNDENTSGTAEAANATFFNLFLILIENSSPSFIYISWWTNTSAISKFPLLSFIFANLYVENFVDAK